MKKIFIILFAVVTASCSSVKKAEVKRVIAPLTPFAGGTHFVGSYKNIDSSLTSSLWSALCFKCIERESWKEMSVRFRSGINNQLVAELISEEGIVDTKELKGKFINNFYILKRQFKTDFTYIIAWVLADSSVKLALTPEDNLIVVRQSGGFLLLAAFPFFASGTGVSETIYESKH